MTWKTFPLKEKSKQPRHGLKWKEPFDGKWRDGENVGLHLGPSNVVDIDLDWPEAQTTGGSMMKSSCTFGRNGLTTHILLNCPEITKSVKFALPKSFDSMLPASTEGEHRFVVAEIRAGNSYTMIPPSVHPSGDKVEFIKDGDPDDADAAKVRRMVGVIAFIAVCERFWANGGSRHECAVRMAGMLRHAGYDQEFAEEWIGLIVREDGDEQAKDRLRTVKDTYKSESYSGWEKFRDAFGFPDNSQATFKRWLGMGKKSLDSSKIDGLNKKYAVIRNKNTGGVLVEDIDPILKRTSYSVMSQATFKLIEPSPEAVAWLASSPPSRRTYPNGFIFDPDNQHEGYFNLWRGWSVKPKAGDWSLMQKHIETISRDAPEWIIKWLAWSFQNPGSPAEVVPVYRGKKGTGKGTLGRLLVHMAGSHGIHISNRRHLVGNFNAHMRDCVFLFGDEVFWPGDYEGGGVLKALITESTLAIEQKGVDVGSVANLLHIVMASNEDWVVPATSDERRFVVYDVPDDLIGDIRHFSDLYSQLDSGGYEGMLFDLLAMDLGDWHPRQHPPMTQALRDQIQASEKPEVAVLRSMLELGYCPGTYSAYHSRNELLFPEFRDLVHEHAFGRNVTDKSMGMALSRIEGARKDNNGETVIGIAESGKPEMRRCRRYLMPPLAECRSMFDPDHDWPEEPSEWEWEHATEGQNDLPEDVVKNPPF